MSGLKILGTNFRIDALGWLFLSLLTAAAVAAIYAALHFGWFKSPWQLGALLAIILAVMFGGLVSQGGQQSTVAHSKYATREDIQRYDIETDEAKPDKLDQGIYLGEFQDHEKKWAKAELRYKEGKHLVGFGGTGSGKSTSIVTPNLQNLRRSMIVTDPKGELAFMTARRRGAADFGKVIILNPFGAYLDHGRDDLETVGWNPLLQLDPTSDDFAADAMCVADAIIVETGNESQPYFNQKAKSLVRAIVMHLRLQRKEHANLCDLSGIMSRDFLETVKAMSESANEVVKNTGSEYYQSLTNQNALQTGVEGIKSTLIGNLDFLDDPRIKDDMLRGGAIDFASLRSEVTTIYLMLPVEALREQSQWLRLFVNLALRKLLKKPAPTNDKPSVPVLFMLDEFGNIGRLQEIVTALNLGRSFGLQLFFFLQDLPQLKRLYKDDYSSFFSNAGASFAFKTGALDNETAEHLAKSFGKQQMNIVTVTQRGGSEKPEAVDLLRPEEFSRLPPRTIIGVIEPCPWPVKAATPLYKDTRFTAGLDPHPDYG